MVESTGVAVGDPVTGRRWSAVGALAGLVVVLVGGWAWIPWADSPTHVTAVPALSVFTPAEIARAKDFSGSIRVPGLLALFLSVAVLVVIAVLPHSRRLLRGLSARLPWWLVVVVAVLVIRLAVALVTLPMGLWERQLLLKFGLTHQGLSGWLTDQALGTMTTVVADSVVVLVLVGFARVLPRAWPLAAGTALAALVFAGSFVYPVVVEPMFNHFTPLPAGQLRTQILQLARREGVSVNDVLVADASRRTTELNAYVSGFGSTRRVVLYDTLLHGVPEGQILVVVAHELAHARHQDVLKGTALGAAGAFTGTCLLGLVAGGLVSRRSSRRELTLELTGRVPALLAIIAISPLVVAPVGNAASRAVELRADADALRVTADPTSFIDLQRSLALRSLADPTPPRWLYWWFATHPTSLERVGLVGQQG